MTFEGLQSLGVGDGSTSRNPFDGPERFGDGGGDIFFHCRNGKGPEDVPEGPGLECPTVRIGGVVRRGLRVPCNCRNGRRSNDVLAVRGVEVVEVRTTRVSSRVSCKKTLVTRFMNGTFHDFS